MTKRKDGAPLTVRAPRRPQVDIAVVATDEIPSWNRTAETWQAIEESWGRQIPIKARDEIERATRAYLCGETLARSAAFIDDVRSELAAFAKAMRDAKMALSSLSRDARDRLVLAAPHDLTSIVVDATDALADLTQFAEVAVGDLAPRAPHPVLDDDMALKCALAMLDEPDRLAMKSGMDDEAVCARFNEAVGQAVVEARAVPSEDEPQADDGPPLATWAAWDHWIVSVWRIAVDHKLPQGTDPSMIKNGRSPKLPPFARAIKALHGTLPKGYARPYGSDRSLVEMINKLIKVLR